MFEKFMKLVWIYCFFWQLEQEEEMMRMMPYVYNGNFHHLLNNNNAEITDEANDSFQL